MTPQFTEKSTNAEIGVLSCLRANLIEAGGIMVQSGVTEDHFVEPHSALYRVLMEMWRDGKEFDFIAFCGRLRASGDMHKFPDRTAIQAPLYESSHISTLSEHISALMECKASRALYTLGKSLCDRAFSTTESMGKLLEEASTAVATVTTAPRLRKTRLNHFINQAIEQIQSAETGENSIEFGLGLDEKAGPFSRGDLVVIAAETKKGKSALAGNIIENVAESGKTVHLFSLEMTGWQNAERMMASQARVDIRSLKLRGRITKFATQQDLNDMNRLTIAAKGMDKWKVDIFEDIGSIEQICGEILRGKPDLAVVDYGQLVDGLRSKGDNREREVASIPRMLKKTATRTNSVIILLSQLNDDGRLRESRAIGQDANCVLFIEGEGDSRTIRVGAARSAPTGTEIEMEWISKFTKFSAP